MNNAPYFKKLFFVFCAISNRELLKFSNQYARLISAIIRPLVWLIIFASGFRSILGVSIVPPYQTYVTYDVYITPGLCAMMILFFGMQTSLSIVYDREMGTMRLLMTAPFPKAILVIFRVFSTSLIGVLQVYCFLFLANLFGVSFSFYYLLISFPVFLICAFMFGMFGLVLSLTVSQLENFAGVMNFVIFPCFFLSSALYPIWKIKESSPFLAILTQYNPFTHAVELIRFSLYGNFNLSSFYYILFFTISCSVLSLLVYSKKNIVMR